jgi:hypothetical protein
METLPIEWNTTIIFHSNTKPPKECDRSIKIDDVHLQRLQNRASEPTEKRLGERIRLVFCQRNILPAGNYRRRCVLRADQEP